MKKIICTIFISLFSMASEAETQPEIDKSVIKFSKTMGIDNMLATTLQQTRKSLKSSMANMVTNLRQKYPNMSEADIEMLQGIFTSYTNSIVDSIDIEKAAYIYAAVISKGVSKEAIDEASAYYASSEGQNMLKVVAVASAELNQYLLDTIAESSNKAQNQLMNALEQFNTRMLEGRSK